MLPGFHLGDVLQGHWKAFAIPRMEDCWSGGTALELPLAAPDVPLRRCWEDYSGQLVRVTGS